MKRSPLKRTPLKRKPTKVKRKVKKPTKTSLKTMADKVFSLYIRTKYSDKEGVNQCFTCGKKMTVKTSQAGHFVSRAYLATRYDENNVRVQCSGCNIWGKGKLVEFAANLEKEMPGITQALLRKAQVLQPNFDYQQIINKYSSYEANNVVQEKSY